MQLDCFECGACIAADDLSDLGERFLGHARADHEWPYPDQGIRNYAEATQRLTGPSARLDKVGSIEIHHVTEEHLDDWLAFFDHDAFVGTTEWASCYCLEPHVQRPGPSEAGDDVAHWRDNRAASADRLRHGSTYGYLAYVDGQPAGWVNASKRSDYTLFEPAGGDPPGDDVIGVSCFIVAPPYRRHGIAAALLDRLIADAPARGAKWIEAYPFTNPREGGAAVNFRGPRSLYDERGFEQASERELHWVMRRAAT
jgi:GNAT superfamily N-acetyltransferase